MAILLKDFIKLFEDYDEVIDVFDTTESNWHRTLYEGSAWDFDFNTEIRGNVADEEVLSIFSYETGLSAWDSGICIGIGNPSGR